MNEMDRRVLSRLETTEDLRKTELDRRLENKLESLVDLRREHIAAFTTRADPHMHYFGIISNRTIQAWQGNVGIQTAFTNLSTNHPGVAGQCTDISLHALPG